MKIFPAVDIKDGQAVRLKKGDFEQVKIYFSDPVDAAAKWLNDGTNVLHVVDLDGAKEGRPVNADSIKRIASLGVKIQLGGGLRSLESIRAAFDLGIWRAVIGTALIKDENLAKEASEEFGDEKIVAGVDLKDSQVAVEGWQEGSSVDYEDLLEQLQSLGIRNLIVTDINRDGMQEGPNFDLMKKIVQYRSLPTPDSRFPTNFNVIASGGVSSLSDIRRLTEIGVTGAIIGTALYENSFSLAQALEAANVS